MENESWGPWIEHDGKGCPCVGDLVDAIYESGQSEPFIAEGGASWYRRGTLQNRRHQEILRYRIRNPRQSTATGYAEVLKALDREAGETPYMPVRRKVGV